MLAVSTSSASAPTRDISFSIVATTLTTPAPTPAFIEAATGITSATFATLQRLWLALVSAGDQARMHTHLDEIVWQFHNALDDVTEATEQLYCDLIVLLHFCQRLSQLVNLICDLFRDILFLDVSV